MAFEVHYKHYCIARECTDESRWILNDQHVYSFFFVRTMLFFRASFCLHVQKYFDLISILIECVYL